MKSHLIVKSKSYYQYLTEYLSLLSSLSSASISGVDYDVYSALQTLLSVGDKIQYSSSDSSESDVVIAMLADVSQLSDLPLETRQAKALLVIYENGDSSVATLSEADAGMTRIFWDLSKRRRMPDLALIGELFSQAKTQKTLSDRHVVITAGPTREALDPVTYMTNPSSGKMGMAFARAAKRKGAKVSLIIANGIAIPDDVLVDNILRFTTVSDLEKHAHDLFTDATDILMSAAVGDCELVHPNVVKNKKRDRDSDTFFYEMRATRDVLVGLCRRRHDEGQKLRIIGFAAETSDLDAYASAKLVQKGCDAILANWVSSEHGNAFGSDTTTLLSFTAERRQSYGPGSKTDVAASVLADVDAIKITMNAPKDA